MKRWVLLSLLLTSCATPYQESGFTGGVISRELNEGLFEVIANGNGYTSSARIRDFTMLKAAETCLAEGYESFTPVEQETSVRTQTFSTPRQTTCNDLGSTVSCQSSGGSVHTFRKPGRHMVVKMFKADEPMPDITYSCRTIYDNLASIYIE